MRYLVTFVLAVMLALPVVAQDFAKGLEAYERGDYATAMRELRRQRSVQARRHVLRRQGCLERPCPGVHVVGHRGSGRENSGRLFAEFSRRKDVRYRRIQGPTPRPRVA